MITNESWYEGILRDAIEKLLARPATRRGSCIITDAQLHNALRALKPQEPRNDDR